MDIQKIYTQEVEGASEEKEKYPKAVFFILGNEFCERFCFYGMRTILTIYLTEELAYNPSKAIIIFHSFIMLAYFTPLLGAIMADSWLGKFKTIFYLSVVYAIGNVILSVGSVPFDVSTMKAVSLIGLFIIAVGTGGIKPCVSAFGGDQFSPNQEKERQKFFSIFYFAINSGSVLSTLATPILRKDVHCFGSDSCYPLAYGIPAFLMIVALALFLLGKPLYIIRPREGNIFASVIKCIRHALSRKAKSSEKKKSHWLDYADDKFDKGLIKDIQALLKVLWIFLPVPVFWALFDQTGSSWTLQATKMNGEVLGFHIKPDQMQVMNSIMIIVFIPLFDYIIYPFFSKIHLFKKPLQRIAVGGFLSALAFVATGLVELSLEKDYPVLPADGFSDFTIINNSPCNIKINMPERSLFTLDEFEVGTINDIEIGKELSWEFIPSNCSVTESITKTLTTSSSIESMMVTTQNEKLQISQETDTKTRSSEGAPKVRIYFSTDYTIPQNSSFKLVAKDLDPLLVTPNLEEASNLGVSDYYETAPGKYKIFVPINTTAHQAQPIEEIELRSGGIYIVVIYQNVAKNLTNLILFPMLKHNSISILYQIPAYVILTSGEIMFSITGLEFSYSQAPQSMKSVVQAAWLLTVAFGNLIVMVIAKLSLFEKQSYEMFMFSVLMGLDMLIFSVMAYFYKYVNKEEKGEKPDKKKVDGHRNEAYEEETDFNK